MAPMVCPVFLNKICILAHSILPAAMPGGICMLWPTTAAMERSLFQIIEPRLCIALYARQTLQRTLMS